MIFRIKPAAGLLAIAAIGILAGVSFLVHSDPSLLRGAIKQDPKTANLFEKTGTVRSEKIVESSGLAFSHRTQNVLYTHNDSGHGVELFAVSLAGDIVREFEIKGAKNVDWEAMTSFTVKEQPYLMVADVGDNLAKRDSCQLYIFPEPEVEATGLEIKTRDGRKPITIQSKVLDFEYEDGPKNCEAIGVDPISNEIWLVEKVYFDARQTKPPGIYVLTMPISEGKSDSAEPNADKRKQNKRRTSKKSTAKRIGDFNVRNVTGMAFSRDGKRLIIRNYLNAHLYERSEEMSWRKTVTTSRPIPIPLPLQRQGEAICFTPDSRSLIVSSEMRRQAIWKVDLDGYLASRNQEAAKRQPTATFDGKDK